MRRPQNLKKSTTFFKNYFVTSKQSKSFSNFFGLLRISELYLIKSMRISSFIHQKWNYFTVSSSGEKQVSFSHSLLFSAWIAFEWQWSKVHSQICNHYIICMQVSQIFRRFHKKNVCMNYSLKWHFIWFESFQYAKSFLMHNDWYLAQRIKHYRKI